MRIRYIYISSIFNSFLKNLTKTWGLALVKITPLSPRKISFINTLQVNKKAKQELLKTIPMVLPISVCFADIGIFSSRSVQFWKICMFNKTYDFLIPDLILTLFHQRKAKRFYINISSRFLVTLSKS